MKQSHEMTLALDHFQLMDITVCFELAVAREHMFQRHFIQSLNGSNK